MTRVLGWLALLSLGVIIGLSLIPLTRAIWPEPLPEVEEEALTVEVERRTLRSEVVVRGQTRRPDAGEIVTQTDGTVTRLAVKPGHIITQGDAVFDVNDRQVVAVAGDQPFWRELDEGSRGPDVERLEAILVSEGFLEVSNDRYDEDTSNAVTAWETSLGDPNPDGVFDPGSVLVAPWPLRVSEVLIRPGDHIAAGQPIINATVDQVEVVLFLSANDLTVVARGDPVILHWPTGLQPEGEIERISDVPVPDPEGALTWEGLVRVADPPNLEAEVQLRASVITAQAENVLAVPIAAVVTDSEGGPAVRVVNDGRESPVSVSLGLADTPWVEVRSGVEEGDVVVLTEP